MNVKIRLKVPGTREDSDPIRLVTVLPRGYVTIAAIKAGQDHGVLMDSNGNKVGAWRLNIYQEDEEVQQVLK